ncbi:AMP-binding protein [Marinobacter profundi]|uniref:AMP-binding protein n=1 Tax=Marinobacter profundi TaxID=2666256 RepID=UPI0014756F72|nr:AMP-binding protein [Marinobacter profundi]
MALLPELIARLAARQPETPALVTGKETLTYRELLNAAGNLAAILKARGLTRLGLAGDNAIGWVVADLACLMARIVCVPVPGFFSAQQSAHLTAMAGLEGLLEVLPPSAAAQEEDASGLERLTARVALRRLPAGGPLAPLPPGTAKITFTSGSTGNPKGVCLSAAQLTATTLALGRRLEAVALQRHLCVLPLATLLENIAGVYLPLSLGATVVLEPLASLGFTGSSQLEIPRLLAVINRVRPHSVILVPELASVLVGAAETGALDTAPFQFVAVGGGKVSPRMLARARAVGLPMYEGYGLSECGSVVALNVPGAARAGTVGRPLDHVAVAVGDDGEIRIAGSTHLGYLGEPREPGAELATGDLGRFDNGFLVVNGRRKNLLITSYGRNISPEWLESELVQAAGARQAFVFGEGEPHPCALLAVGSGSPAEIAAALAGLNARLPDYMRLQTVYLRRQPWTREDGYLTANGRPLRSRLNEDLPALLASAHPLTLDVSCAAPAEPAAEITQVEEF